jgi:hypothetical protein
MDQMSADSPSNTNQWLHDGLPGKGPALAPGCPDTSAALTLRRRTGGYFGVQSCARGSRHGDGAPLCWCCSGQSVSFY